LKISSCCQCIADIRKLCHHYNFQNGKCPFGKRCNFIHQFAKASERDEIPLPRLSFDTLTAEHNRARSNGREPSRGKCKGSGKASDAGAAPSAFSRGRSVARKHKLYCEMFLKQGECPRGDSCRDPHLDEYQVAALRAVYGNDCNNFLPRAGM